MINESALALAALCTMIVGFLWGLATAHRPRATRMVELRALKAFVIDPANGDDLVRSLARRQIRRLEHSLRIDDDED